jgi:hypothetical protein
MQPDIQLIIAAILTLATMPLKDLQLPLPSPELEVWRVYQFFALGLTGQAPQMMSPAP